MKHEPTKCTFSELMFNFLILMSTSFETDGSSAGRRLYLQLWYDVFYMLLIPTHAQHTIP